LKERPAIQSFRGKRKAIELSKQLTQGLKALSPKEGVTLYMALLAAFQTLLYRYTGQEDIVVGSPIANRNRREIEGLIGFFVNTLVLRSNFTGNPTFRELLAQVRQVALEAYEHQDLPFEKLVEELKPERSLSYSPLFQVMFVLQNAPLWP
jgi:non-ribosomal peptide synthetase component F